MTKPQIAERLAHEIRISVSRAALVPNRLISTRKGKGLIPSELEAGRPFRLVGFGTFVVKKRGTRQERNPKSGAGIKIPATSYVVFRAGPEIRTRMTE